MAFHHLAFGAKDIQATHDFYEGIMGFELVKVEIAPLRGGGWGKHFFYRINGDNARFIAFWELNETPNQDEHIYDLNKAMKLPELTAHYSFEAKSVDELMAWKDKWNAADLDVLEIDHNWCHSVYTRDPDGNGVEFCVTTGTFTQEDRERALAAITEREFNPSPPPAKIEFWLEKDAKVTPPAGKES